MQMHQVTALGKGLQGVSTVRMCWVCLPDHAARGHPVRKVVVGADLLV